MSKDENLHSFIAGVNELYKPVQGRETGFDVDFLALKRLSSSLKQSKDHETIAGQKPENKKKNRYKDILPFDFSRVKLVASDDDPNSDYINASFIKGAEGHKNYIASQGPLPHTVLDFWQMLWQYNVSVIVMVCREFEMGKKKCERYWSEKGESKEFGDITVTLNEIEELKDGYCLRTIKVHRGSESRYIRQFHYTSWPDHGVPKTCYEILTLINHVRDMQTYAKDVTTPLCVHCSAGCGRTGALLAVDYVRNLLAKSNVPNGLRAYDIISEMRKQRPAIVQTRDQYEFVNAAVSEMFGIYLQTRSVTYKDFSTGYVQGDYVNINLSTASHNGTPEPKPQSNTRPTTLSYENIDIVREHGNVKKAPSPQVKMGKAFSVDEYPPDPPPAKPSRTTGDNVRPVSMILSSAANSLPGGPPPTKIDSRRKQSSPVIGYTPSAKPNPNKARSPLKPSGPKFGKEVKPQPPVKPKPTKVDTGSKNSLAARSSGKEHPSNVQLHGKITADSSVKKLSLSLLLTSPSKSPSSPKSASSPKVFFARIKTPDKPPNSPLRNHFEMPEANLVKKRIEALSPTDSNQSQSTTENKSISDNKKNESPKASDVMQKEKVPPVLLPKPRGNALTPVKVKTPISAKSGVPVRHLRPNANVRPLSQNFVLSSNPLVKPVMSNSVLDVRKEDSTPPILPQKRPSVMRSASVGRIDSPEQVDSYKTARAKFQNKEPDRDVVKSVSKVEVKVVPVNSAYTQAAASYGAVVFTTKGPIRSNSLRGPPQNRPANYPATAPTPFKPLSSKLSLPRRGPLNADGGKEDKKSHYASTSSLFTSTVLEIPEAEQRHNYVNTDFPSKQGILANKVHSVDTLPTSAGQAEAHSLGLSPERLTTQTPSPTPRRRRARNLSPKTDYPTLGAYQNIQAAGANNSTDDPSPSHGSVSSTFEQGDSGALKPPLAPKTSNGASTEAAKKKPPTKPRRTVKASTSPIPPPKVISGIAADEAEMYSTSNKTSTGNFQKYNKNHLYNDVIPGGSRDDSKNQIAEATYEDFQDTVRRSSSVSSVDRPTTPGVRTKTPPKLPARTPEAQIFLSESPPSLPMRTPDMFVTVEGIRQPRWKQTAGDADEDGQQAYEAVDHSSTQPPDMKNCSDDRRSSSTSTVGASSIAAKAKGYFEKTTTAISKVGASLTKSIDDDAANARPSTIDQRTPTYTAGPTTYSGQDMSFGKRLMKKVKGGRSFPNK